MDKTYFTIYKVTNKISGKIYIGSHKTKNLDDGYYGSGKYLKRSIEKNGIENFIKEILFVFDTPEEMFAKEAELVNEDFLANENTYNIRLGGFGGFDHINNDYELVVKRNRKISKNNDYSDKKRFYQMSSEYAKSKYNTNYAFQNTHHGLGFLGKKHKESTKKIIGENSAKHQIGEGNSQFGTVWITNGIVDKKIKKGFSYPEGFKKGRLSGYNVPVV